MRNLHHAMMESCITSEGLRSDASTKVMKGRNVLTLTLKQELLGHVDVAGVLVMLTGL